MYLSVKFVSIASIVVCLWMFILCKYRKKTSIMQETKNDFFCFIQNMICCYCLSVCHSYQSFSVFFICVAPFLICLFAFLTKNGHWESILFHEVLLWLWFWRKSAFSCIILIDRVLRRVLVSFDCQTVFVLQNSHDAFLSETVSDPLIFGFLPCHLWFFTLSFQRFYSNKVPFYEPCGTKGDGKSRFCLDLRKEWLFCALYFVSKRGGCFVKNVGSFY